MTRLAPLELSVGSERVVTLDLESKMRWDHAGTSVLPPEVLAACGDERRCLAGKENQRPRKSFGDDAEDPLLDLRGRAAHLLQRTAVFGGFTALTLNASCFRFRLEVLLRCAHIGRADHKPSDTRGRGR